MNYWVTYLIQREEGEGGKGKGGKRGDVREGENKERE